MSFSDILSDVVDPDVLAENDIADKFPNGDDKLFDVNEFLGPNQGPKHDMGLNLQVRQA